MFRSNTFPVFQAKVRRGSESDIEAITLPLKRYPTIERPSTSLHAKHIMDVPHPAAGFDFVPKGPKDGHDEAALTPSGSSTVTAVDHNEDPEGAKVSSTSTAVNYDEAPKEPKNAECGVCWEEHPVGLLTYFCSPPPSSKNASNTRQGYCHGCFIAAIRHATKDRTPFRCDECNKIVHPKDYPKVPFSAEDILAYVAMVEETTTPNPVYCSNPHCGSLIPPNMTIMGVAMGVAICRKCGEITCKKCRRPCHLGAPCPPQDQDTLKMLALAERKGWKSCPRCNYMVELTVGCSIVRCLCGWSFCYKCGASQYSRSV